MKVVSLSRRDLRTEPGVLTPGAAELILPPWAGGFVCAVPGVKTPGSVLKSLRDKSAGQNLARPSRTFSTYPSLAEAVRTLRQTLSHSRLFAACRAEGFAEAGSFAVNF